MSKYVGSHIGPIGVVDEFQKWASRGSNESFFKKILFTTAVSIPKILNMAPYLLPTAPHYFSLTNLSLKIFVPTWVRNYTNS